MSISTSSNRTGNPAGTDRGDPNSFLSNMVREPLFQFLVLAGLLFIGQALFAKDDRDLIVVDAATQEYLFAREAELLLRPLSEDEKQELVRNFVEEEILVREAVKRGFSDGSRIRALLLQNMRFFIAGDLAEPTDAELKEYFDSNPENFRSPPSYDLDHVMFNSVNEVSPNILDALNEGADPKTLGDADITFGSTLRYMDQKRLVQAFGGETANEVLTAIAQNDEWHGPFQSQTGSIHFLRVIRENPAQLPEFEQAKDWVATRWMTDKSRELLEQELRSVEIDYKVEIAPLQGDREGE